MTVNTELARAEFAWTGVESAFAAGFPADKAGDVRVFYRTPAGVISTLLAGVNYTVTLATGSKLVTVVPVTLPPAPGTVVVRRSTPALVTDTLQDSEGFSLEVIQKLHDVAAMRSAEDRDTLARAITLEEGAALGEGDFNLGGSGLANVGEGTSPNHAATVAQIQAIVAASGNVPAPVLAELNRLLVATGPGTFGWLALALSMIPDALFTADAAGRAKFADKIWTLAKLQDISQFEVLGRVTAGSGPVERLTPAQVRTITGQKWATIFDQTVTGSAAFGFDVPLLGYDLFRITLRTIPNTAMADSALVWNGSNDGGVTFKGGATDYQSSYLLQSGTSVLGAGQTSAAFGQITGLIDTNFGTLVNLTEALFSRGAYGESRMFSKTSYYDGASYAQICMSSASAAMGSTMNLLRIATPTVAFFAPGSRLIVEAS